MTAHERRLYRIEVEELTAYLRTDPEWEELRRVLLRRRVRPSEALLAAFMEDGGGMEYGVLVTGDGRVIEYHRRIGLHRRGPRVLRWRDRTDDPQALVDYPQLVVALEMHGGTEQAAGPMGLLHYFERIHPSHPGVALCRRWLALQSRSDVSQTNIDRFVAEMESRREPGSGWQDLDMRFRGWARSRGFEV